MKKFIFIMILSFIFLTILLYLCNIKINTTKSMPIGIYQTYNNNILPGDIVTFNYQNVNFLKKVVAVAGDYVEIKNSKIFVNHKLIKDSQIFKFDSNHNALPTLSFSGVLKNNEIFVLGEHIKSFDSRYFGVLDIQKNSVKKAKEILTWSDK
ncbi:conjugative transfer signal peptidase TraF (plasmid) [Campylobacter vicugnae]|uniref:Signal peptidase I n=1 Tax=Campylobacter vicugnae TaxID=1660076 RepID=A0A1X9T3T9_9BACT|nr:S26 family signal peptidase [Campylobacter sp. RM8964]ARR03170.1 conjugative transfer signal peptidase TraF [Campylobacter sp. RM8964]